MSERLSSYHAKRHFERTPEPPGGRPSPWGAIFVVQEHHARRLHWDLRLEHGGALWSWAVTKEPPAEPGVRRLAVHVEDHPLDYATFEGEIPAGEYGAGTVSIWDRGIWLTEEDPETQLAAGKLDFELLGARLNGRYVLIKIEKSETGKDWLLLRAGHDKLHLPSVPGASEGRVPAHLGPMLCTQRDAPPAEGDWLHEIKWDGYRVIVHREPSGVTIESRNGHRLRLPGLIREFEALPPCILDGELIALDDQGRSHFPQLQDRLSSGDESGLQVALFDLLWLDGVRLTGAPIEARKAVLARLLAEHPLGRARLSTHVIGSAQILLDSACGAGLEGIVSKRLGSTYVSRRSESWVKSRCEDEVEAIVGGYTALAGDEEAVGALWLGLPTDEGGLRSIGKVGTGFTHAQRRQLWKQLEAIRTPTLPFTEGEVVKRGARWVEPKLRVVVRHRGWGGHGALRQSVFVQIVEPPEPSIDLSVITHPERVVDPESGSTKGDIAAYYAAMASWILPHVSQRPLPVLRCPGGLAEGCFFHKHTMPGLRDGAVGRVSVEEGGEPYMQIEGAQGLIALVQMGTIEFHPWGSRSETLEQPERLIFDLDPGPGVSYDKVIEAARELKATLNGLGLPTLAMLSGGKGFHVIVPIKPELTWPEVKAFCETLARQMAKTKPDRYVATLSKKVREGRIFIDYMRNGRGATAVAPYSLRARPGLPAAMPAAWEEIENLAPNTFDIRTAVKHVRTRAADPWDGVAPGSLVQALGLADQDQADS